MSDNNNHPLGKAPWLHVIISTGFGTGFIPGAPGTYAAFLALIMWYGLYFIISATSLLWVTVGLVILNMAVGVWTSNVMERYWGPDPRTVVIDEFIGVWIPCLVCATPSPATTLWLAVLGFASFRIIDIFKPLGCRKMEKFTGGWGVMLDDVLAGIYALIIVLFAKWIIGII